MIPATMLAVLPAMRLAADRLVQRWRANEGGRWLLSAVGILVGVALMAWAQGDLSDREFSSRTALLLITGGVVLAGSVLYSGLRPLIPPAEEDVVQDSRSRSPLRVSYRRAGLLTLSLVMVGAAFVLNNNNAFTGPGVIAWFLAIGLFIAAWWQRAPKPSGEGDPDPPPHRLWPILAVLSMIVVVAGLALFFRYFRINELPGHAGGVEADIADNVREVVNGEFRMYMIRDISEGGLIYVEAGAAKILGVALDFNLIKGGSAFFGLLAVGATYLLVKELFSSRLAGLIAALFMAVAHWPVTISRTALTASTSPFWVALTLLFLVRVLKHGRRNDFLLLGLVSGFGLYFYLGLRIVPLLLLVCLALKAITILASRRPRESAAFFGKSVLAALTVLVVFTPMARTWHDDPDYYMDMLFERSRGVDRAADYDVLERFSDNTKAVFYMFNWSGDHHPLHNVPWRPALDDTMAPLLLAGTAIGLAVWLRHRRGLFPYLAIAFTFLLMPSSLVLAFPAEVPSFARTSGAMPLTFAFVALPVALGLAALARGLPRIAGGATVALTLAVLVVGLTVVNYRWYFDDYDESYWAAAFDEITMMEAIKEAQAENPDIDHVYIVGYPGWIDPRGVNLLFAQPDWLTGVYPIPEASLQLQGPSRLLFVLADADIESLDRLEGQYPRGTVSYWQGRRGEPDAFRLYITSVLESLHYP